MKPAPHGKWTAFWVGILFSLIIGFIVGVLLGTIFVNSIVAVLSGIIATGFSLDVLFRGTP